ncbi:hypothetical protein [Nitratireductor luteus]|uniref:hypothetical protein n=1 Tax=Nitratireductor luteus TaxID=2976980 RepID=UPI00223FF4BF|nr:hypothetical protein [Nitratireductor luteus]
MKIARPRRNYCIIAIRAAFGAGFLAASGSCSTMALDEIAPQPTAAVLPPPAAAQPTQPDGYPNLNIRAEPAFEQLSDEDRAALTDDLAAARARQGSAASAGQAASERERLRRLALQHGDEAQREIEATE